MPRINGNGPDNKGSKTGRKLGACSGLPEKNVTMFGIGLGNRYKSGGGKGMGKRLKYDLTK